MMFIKDNPAFLIVAAVCSVGVLSATGAVSAFGVLLTGVNNSVVSTSFTAEDDQIKKVEQDFRALEADLSSKMDSVEEDYPGYDEYRYTIAPIKH
ncbi:MAG: NlpC/P60 family protein, partial [Lachnospiraceae bacterium]|nr:NlpC/P60 family protein [Lachnospiraceae bacterium]